MNHKLSERVRVTLTHETAGTSMVNMLIDDLQFGIKKQGNDIFNRKELNTTFLFRGENYTYLQSINDDAAARCLPIDLLIEHKDNTTSNYFTLHEGYFSLNDGDFDRDNCTIRIKSRIDDEYTKLENLYKRKVNIYSNQQTVSVRHLPESATVETQIIPVQIGSAAPIPPTAEGWVKTQEKFEYLIVGGIPTTTYVLTERTYSRIINTFATPPPDELGWINVGGTTYAQQPRLGETITEGVNPKTVTRLIKQVENTAIGDNDETIIVAASRAIDNGIRFSNVLDRILLGSGYTIISDFFGINADNTAPVNEAYIYAQKWLIDPVYIRSSSVRRPDSEQNAFRYEVSLEELEKQCNNYADVVFFTDPNNPNILRIEHISYLENSPVTLDLTTLEGGRFIKQKDRYTYEDAVAPVREKFGYAVESDYDGFDFDYNPICSGEKSEEKSYLLTDVVVDYLDVIYDDEKFSDSQLVILSVIAFDGENYITYLPSTVEAGNTFIFNENLPQANGAMSFYQLQRNVWLHKRPQLSARWAGNQISVFVFSSNFVENITFNTVKNIKKQVSISISNFTAQDWIQLNVNHLIDTQISNKGEFLSVTYSLKSNLLTVELLH